MTFDANNNINDTNNNINDTNNNINDTNNDNNINISFMEEKANQIRNKVLDMINTANHGHIGSCLSCVDIMTVLYYNDIITHFPNDPKSKQRDRFIMSKGHASPVLHTILADLGYFPYEKLSTYALDNSEICVYPSMNIPGVELATGSLGHGLAVGNGLSISAKMNGENHKIYVLLGDCECHEGSVWESIMFAGHHGLNNLIAIVDYNKQCASDYIKKEVDLIPLSEKWKSFNWNVIEIDGHSFIQISNTLNMIKNSLSIKKPTVIIANTIKGKGVRFMEGIVKWHNTVPSKDEYEKARKELNI